MGKIRVPESLRRLKRLGDMMRALDHIFRLRILILLRKNEVLTVTDLWVKLRSEQSVVSQHLAVLREVGLVDTTRSGKFIYYEIDSDGVSEYNKLVNSVQANQGLFSFDGLLRDVEEAINEAVKSGLSLSDIRNK
jgi:DNA-binding transcriptional ArsR family regulator